MHSIRNLFAASLLLAVGCGGAKMGDETGDSDTSDQGDGSGGSGEGESGDGDGDGDGDGTKCADKDGDGVPLDEDNARDHYNPDQADSDKDGFGDVADLCPVTPSQTNTADSDKDGVGNACDTCRRTAASYNEGAQNLPGSIWVRPIPTQSDFDQDGIGDACDNCPAVPNCEDYGPNNPFEVGDPIDDENEATCQTDEDSDMLGDACLGVTLPGAAGPAGFGDMDDFDQDGLFNIEDACPRLPALHAPCGGDDDCADGQECVLQGICNHTDTDGDGVGNACDTCPYNANFDQITDGGMQEDDEDGDFVGAACETNAECYVRADPRPFAFAEVAVDGMCCTSTYRGDGQYVHNGDGSWGCEGNCDPNGLPILADCENDPGANGIPDGAACRKLPDSVLEKSGTVNLPPGCDQALADAGLGPDQPLLDIDDFDGNHVAMWSKMCFLPQLDSDFDGVGDACDLCPFAFDPDNTPYVDENQKVWPDDGKFCNGDYACE